MALRHTDRLIGDCGAHVQAEDSRQAEIGFTLAPPHQGHGYATEAVRRCCTTYSSSEASIGSGPPATIATRARPPCLVRVGMRREGHLLESTWSKGEWTNDLLYGVLRREWPSGS